MALGNKRERKKEKRSKIKDKKMPLVWRCELLCLLCCCTDDKDDSNQDPVVVFRGLLRVVYLMFTGVLLVNLLIAAFRYSAFL